VVEARKTFFIAGIMLGLSLIAAAQSPRLQPATASSKKAAPSAPRKLTPQQKFVMDTVSMAVALPQPDPQDRLRVLASAANVVSPIDSAMAKNLWREGVRIESELVQTGRTPAVSMVANGHGDCGSSQIFVENLPQSAVVAAEQSLIGAVTTCPKQTLDAVSRKLDAALQKKIVAPRALMAVMEAQGAKSRWSQSHFEAMFGSLPDPGEAGAEAENFAAMYMRMATQVEKSSATKAGLQLLEWLGQLDDSKLRTLAVNITTGAMKQALGEEGFKDALSSDVVASSTVQIVASSGAKGEVQHRPIESASVLGAMQNNGTDQMDRLRDLPASERARESAAHGFAAGTSGNKDQAGKYFDTAFAALDEVWETRAAGQNAAAVVEEISEAVAQVDSVNALERAQKLSDPSAQAIAMLAVARVVASNGVVR